MDFEEEAQAQVQEQAQEQELIDNVTRFCAALRVANEDLLRQWQALQANFQMIKQTPNINGKVSKNNNTSQAFREWIYDSQYLQPDQIRLVVQLEYAQHYEQLKADPKRRAMSICKRFNTDIWTLYFLFGPEIVQSQAALKLINTIKLHNNNVTLSVLLATLRDARRARDKDRPRYSRHDVTVFSPGDVKNAASILAPQLQLPSPSEHELNFDSAVDDEADSTHVDPADVDSARNTRSTKRAAGHSHDQTRSTTPPSKDKPIGIEHPSTKSHQSQVFANITTHTTQSRHSTAALSQGIPSLVFSYHD